MNPDRAAKVLSRFILPGFISVLAGRPQSGRTTLAQAMAMVWRRAGVGALYLSVSKEAPADCPDLWCRHRPHLPYEDIPTLCEEYEQKNGHRLGALIIDRWEEVDHGHRFGAYYDLKYAFLRLKLFSFERQLKTLIVGHDRTGPGDKLRPHLTIPFMTYEAKLLMLMHDDATDGRRVLVWGNYNKPWGKGLAVGYKKIPGTPF